MGQDNVRVEDPFRIDFVIDDCLVVELKSVERTARVHRKQVITSLKLTGMKLGLLINFGDKLIKDGITRLANGMPQSRPSPAADGLLASLSSLREKGRGQAEPPG